ncbi:hypothetical protein GCM10010168_12180 [Actinoplanes ianthinogenes]|uniref:Uncharacterized protein n=1 Tax=Actinoplanes ianthinogenes TaxID=122358 RepID=A0ABN6CIS5_9ACTN|nr:hypothetical protein Aiant_50610 [Actinoplanes ianthinogenes]GGQ97794.1 hypothetical protein GCM10010168_12180 [Actinoplanes ianthinogenes]
MLRFLGVMAAALAVVAFYMVTGEHFKASVLELARAATGGSDRGMAVAAWALVHVPIWLAAALALGLRRIWLGIPPLLLLVPMAPFLPGRGERVDAMVSGPGAAGFADGLRWAGFALIAIPIIGVISTSLEGPGFRRGEPVVAADPAERRRLLLCVLIGAAFSGGALIMAVTVAG